MGSTVAGGVSVVFSAETAQFTAAVKRADDAIGASARSMEAASGRLERAWNRELLAQDRLAEKMQLTARAKELASLKSDILARSEEQSAEAATRSEQSYSRLIQALTNAGSMTTKLSAQNRELAASQEMVTVAGQHQVPAMAASSGALRLLEGNFNNNIRAAERFVGTTLGLAPLLEAAFPVVGAIALTGALVKMGKEAFDATNNFIYLKSAIDGLNELQITVDKKVGAATDSIEEKIESVLEKTQGKTASLQQKYSYQSAKPLDISDYFYDSNYKKLPDAVKGHFETLYKSIAPADIPDRLARIRKEVSELQEAMKFSTTATFGEVTSKVDGFSPPTGKNPGTFYKGVLLAAQQIQKQIEVQSNLRSSGLQDSQEDIKVSQKSDADEKTRKAEEASQKLEAAQRRASQALLRTMDQARQAEVQQGKLGAQADLDYWSARIDKFTAGSAEFGTVQSKIANDQKTLGRSAQEFNAEQARGTEITAKNASSLQVANVQLDLASHAITKVTADQRIGAIQAQEYTTKLQALRTELEQLNKNASVSPEDKKTRGAGIQNQIVDVSGQQQAASVQERVKGVEALNQEARAALQDADALDQLADVNRRNVDAMTQLTLAHNVATGAISKHDQAVQLSAQHAADYAAQLDELQGQRDRISNSTGLDAQQKKDALDKIDIQVSSVQGDADRTSLTDKWAVQQQTAVGGFLDALREITSAGKDTAAQFKSITSQLVSGVNKTLVEALTSRDPTGKRDLWGNLGHDLAVKGTTVSLQAGEAGILGMLSAVSGSHGASKSSSVLNLGAGSNALSRSEVRGKLVKLQIKSAVGLPGFASI